MELKEGMYIRYIPTIGEYTQKISKITKTKNCLLDMAYTLDDKEEVFSSHFDEVLKASNNIIDLIEDGDYVNGGLVEMKQDNYIMVGFAEYEEPQKLYNGDIKSIVTKEQFSAMEYKID